LPVFAKGAFLFIAPYYKRNPPVRLWRELFSRKILKRIFDAPPPLADARRQTKKFLNIFNLRAPKFFSIKEKKFFCFGILLTQKGGNVSTPTLAGILW